MWSNFWTHVSLFISVLYGITILFIILLIILENRDPVKTISWTLVIMLIPVFGVISYILFGQNYRKQKIFSRKGLRDLTRMANISDQQLQDFESLDILDNDKIKSKSNIISLLLRNSKAILTKSNKVEVLFDGEATFDSIIEAIGSAEDHIHMEFYRWESDQIGHKIKDALIKKAREGLKIRLIYDDVGSWKISKKYVRDLRNEGIQVKVFMPVRFPYFTSKVNFRNHRKIVVVDGIVGYVGGLNIADKYIHGTKKLGAWSDTHLKIEGEAVRSLQTIFSMDWFFVSGKAIGSPNRYFPDHKIFEQQVMQITASGPDSDWASILQAYLAAITSARDYIYISTPYFSPTESILTALFTMALSGVDVKILLPAVSDSTVSYWNSFSYIREMLDAGIEVYLYENGFNHSKLLLVDDIFSSVGTANLDNRSFDLNFEVNAHIYDEDTNRILVERFKKDLDVSRKVNLNSWRKRPFKQKLKESLSRILGPLY